jgi:thiol peroxidase
MDKETVTMKGNPLTLAGSPVNVGDSAPDFGVAANDLTLVKFSDFRGKVCVISSVPSLDTAVCSLQTKRFNEQAVALGDEVAILTISMDLPFAQKRWCGAEGVEAVQTFSDHRKAEFGRAFGVLIDELRLLARAVFVVDGDGIIRYKQIVDELTSEPDYDSAIQAVKDISK